MVLEYIIDYQLRPELSNRSSVYILLNFIYINISGESPRFMQFFFKKT